MRTYPEPPDALEAAAPQLGALGPPLVRLARAQGAWPPVAPARVVDAPAAADWQAGVAAADALVDGGADLVVAAGSSDGGDRALGLLAVLLDLEPVAAVGTAAAPGWAGRVAAVRDGLRAGRPHRADPTRLVAALGVEAVAGLAGVLGQCAVRRTPVLLSGAADVVAAALLAERVGPGTADWLLAGCSPPAGATARALSDLGLVPLLDLRLDRPEGAALALQVLLRGVGLAGG